MPTKKRQELYNIFTTGNKPTEDDFVDLIDSMINIEEDGIGSSEPGQPMEIVEQGTNRRFLDLSSSKDTPIWRISAQSSPEKINGLNFSSNEQSRLFIEQELGYLGINNGNPGAMLHIRSKSGQDTIKISNTADATLWAINADGNTGIGTETSDQYKLSVAGNAYIEDEMDIDGTISAHNGLEVEGKELIVEDGAIVKNGMRIDSGTLLANTDVTIQGGLLTAEKGASISGSALNVEQGITVKNGATIESGEFIVKSGLSVVDATFSANGEVELGNNQGGLVTVNGKLNAQKGMTVKGDLLQAENGAVISGEELLSKNGATVQGIFNATGTVNLGNTVIDSLQVTNAINASNLSLTSVTLENIESHNTTTQTLQVSGESSFYGDLNSKNNTILGSGLIYLKHESAAGSNHFVLITKGTVTSETGHFDISISSDKNITIIYDEDSNLENLDTDWNEYKDTHSSLAENMYLYIAGASSLPLKNIQRELTSSGLPFKEYISTANQLRALYTGAESGTPQLTLARNSNTEYKDFIFTINSLDLTITCPHEDEYRTLEALLTTWDTWKHTHILEAKYFELQQVSGDGATIISEDSGTLKINVNGNEFYQAIIKTDTVSITGTLKFTESNLEIENISSDASLLENSDTFLATQKATKTYIDNGLAEKADKATVDQALDLKADQSTVDTALALKADQTSVDAALADKADNVSVNNALAKKADTTIVISGLAEKADQTAMMAALATKTEMQTPADLTIGAESNAAITGLTLTEQSRGMMMLYLTDGSGTSLATGLFALHGTTAVSKISGDNLSDTEGGATFNLYYNGSELTIENTDAATDITATITYFGA